MWKAKLIRGDSIKPGAVIIDIGINVVVDEDTGTKKYMETVITQNVVKKRD